jgi:hypothetical protein
MKRDMDLIRKVLFEMEKWPLSGGGSDLEIQGYSGEEVTYHIMLLVEAGLIKALDASSRSGPAFIPVRLTWQGHEFLDAARDDTRWNKAKDAMNKAGGFVFEVGKALLIELMKQQLLPKTP